MQNKKSFAKKIQAIPHNNIRRNNKQARTIGTAIAAKLRLSFLKITYDSRLMTLCGIA